MSIPSLTALQLKAEIDSGRSPLLLDVREPDELQISALPHVVNIPMHDLPSRLAELNPVQDIVVVCRVGQRSGRVTQWLLSQGFQSVRNLSDGTNGWARDVDKTLPTY